MDDLSHSFCIGMSLPIFTIFTLYYVVSFHFGLIKAGKSNLWPAFVCQRLITTMKSRWKNASYAVDSHREAYGYVP